MPSAPTDPPAAALQGEPLDARRRARSNYQRYMASAALVGLVSLGTMLLLGILALNFLTDPAPSASFTSPRMMVVPTDRSPPEPLLTMAVGPVLGTPAAAGAWEDLADTIGRQLGVRVSVLHRRSLAEIAQLLDSGEVAIAAIDSGTYVALRQRGVVRLLVVPRVDHSYMSSSLFVVRADSAITRPGELEGRSVALTDEQSAGGALYPTRWLAGRRGTPLDFFGSITWTYGTDRALYAVRNGIVDGAVVDGRCYHQMLDYEPVLARQLKVIHSSPPFGGSPIVVHTSVRSAQAGELQKIFLDLEQERWGQQILEGLRVEGFGVGDPTNYTVVEKMLVRAGG